MSREQGPRKSGDATGREYGWRATPTRRISAEADGATRMSREQGPRKSGDASKASTGSSRRHRLGESHIVNRLLKNALYPPPLRERGWGEGGKKSLRYRPLSLPSPASEGEGGRLSEFFNSLF
jgi:hypothetical protein